MKLTPPFSPALMTFMSADQRGRLPVPLGAKAVAIAHQTLHRHSGQLRQPVQVLEGRGEGLEVTAFQEVAQADFDSGGGQ